MDSLLLIFCRNCTLISGGRFSIFAGVRDTFIFIEVAAYAVKESIISMLMLLKSFEPYLLPIIFFLFLPAMFIAFMSYKFQQLKINGGVATTIKDANATINERENVISNNNHKLNGNTAFKTLLFDATIDALILTTLTALFVSKMILLILMSFHI